MAVMMRSSEWIWMKTQKKTGQVNATELIDKSKKRVYEEVEREKKKYLQKARGRGRHLWFCKQQSVNKDNKRETEGPFACG